jgi:hypothetical protein
MIRQRVRTALLATIVTAAAALPVRAGDGACGPPAPPCAPAVRTIHVTEWVPQHVETVRTVYRTECVPEKYIAYRTECVPEVRTRVVTVHRLVPEVREEVRTVCVSVPCVEQRTVMKKVVTCKPVTTVTRKCVDMGHYECCEVPCRESCWARVKKMCHKGDCCEPCPPPTKTVKVWVPHKVWVETPHTHLVRVCEYVPTVVNVTVCKLVPQQQTFKVTCFRCVPEHKTETFTVLVPRKVAFEATRTVARCVPVQEKVTVCRLVPHTVEKQVPCDTCETCCPPPCCHKCCR